MSEAIIIHLPIKDLRKTPNLWKKEKWKQEELMSMKVLFN